MKIKTDYVIKVGSKGEIFPPKEVREAFDIQPSQPILLKVLPNRIIIQKVDSLEDILSQPSKAKISFHILQQMESEFD